MKEKFAGWTGENQQESHKLLNTDGSIPFPLPFKRLDNCNSKLKIHQGMKRLLGGSDIKENCQIESCFDLLFGDEKGIRRDC